MCELCASPFGKVMRIIRELLVLAEKGAMTVQRSDAVYEELATAIEKLDGTLCECGNCMGTVELQSVCEQWLDRVEDILLEDEDLDDDGVDA